MKISISITHYNNSKFIQDALTVIDKDERISEIIITDDHSSEWNQLKDIINKLNNSKIKLHRNSENLGNFMNKLKSLSLCENEWVILLDADNILTQKYLNAIFNESPWDPNTIYAPSCAKTFSTRNRFTASPYLNFAFAEGQVITPTFIKKYITNESFKTVNMDCCLNVGNYFVNKKEFLRIENKAFGNYNKGRLSNVDYLQTNTEWLCNGKKIKVVKDMHYEHRVHNDSCYSKSNKIEGKRITTQCVKRLFSYKKLNILQ